MTKVLVLGASGMLGNAMFRRLSTNPTLKVFGTTRASSLRAYFDSNISKNIIPGVNIENLDALTQVLNNTKPDIVINCIGLIKQLAVANDPLYALPINTMFPHRLRHLCNLGGTRLIHISTDCVFSGLKGNYKETDFSDATDLYGRSKYLGEIDYNNAITLRTSIIGHELSGTNALIDWFLAQENVINGYTRAIFSGLPTVELSNIVNEIVIPNPKLSGIYHVASRPISKFELLTLVAKIYKKEILILPNDTIQIDRSLNADRFRSATGYTAPSWPCLIERMHKFK